MYVNTYPTRLLLCMLGAGFYLGIIFLIPQIEEATRGKSQGSTLSHYNAIHSKSPTQFNYILNLNKGQGYYL